MGRANFGKGATHGQREEKVITRLGVKRGREAEWELDATVLNSAQCHLISLKNGMDADVAWLAG